MARYAANSNTTRILLVQQLREMVFGATEFRITLNRRRRSQILNSLLVPTLVSIFEGPYGCPSLSPLSRSPSVSPRRGSALGRPAHVSSSLFLFFFRSDFNGKLRVVRRRRLGLLLRLHSHTRSPV